MKTLYIQCNMGAAGDMLTAALMELLSEEEKASFLEKMNSLLPDVTVEAEEAEKCGIKGTHSSVKIHGVEEEGGEDMGDGLIHSHDEHDHDHEYHHHDHDHDHEHHHHDHDHDHDHEHHHHDHDHDHDHHHHHHSHTALADIEATIKSFDLPEDVKAKAFEVYEKLAQAESRAHGKPVAEVHFHEVGEKDAIVDVTAVCYLMSILAPEQVIVSPVHLGSGNVRTAHGILPVPTPATAALIEGMPTYSGEVRGELLTPTGAALLSTFADSYGAMPAMTVAKTGYGMGKKEFPIANCVRALLGETDGSFRPNSRICELMANLDDMTPEMIGNAINTMMDSGALDAFVTPIVMKKNRPGHLFTVICREEEADRFARLILTHTTSFGVRRHTCDRYMMIPEFSVVETKYGPIHKKTATGFGVTKCKPEYEDLQAAAKKHGVTIETVREAFYKEM